MTKMCPNCKTINQDSSGFCKNCGTELPLKASKGGFMAWWNNQTPRGQGVIILASLCCIGLIIIIGVVAMASPDKTTASTSPATNTATSSVPSTNTASSSSPSTPAPTTTTTDKYSGLQHPSEVKSIITQFDHNHDGKIEFVDGKYGAPADGEEEFADWAVSSGMSSSDASTLTQLFDIYDSNKDYFLSIYELDTFYEDYYNN